MYNKRENIIITAALIPTLRYRGTRDSSRFLARFMEKENLSIFSITH